jgi:hypothetical protein
VGLLAAFACLLLAVVALTNGWWHAMVLLLAGTVFLFGWALWVAGAGDGGSDS